jgi:geranylgeranylglycerol-phosphate geranylgeranyltransferase
LDDLEKDKINHPERPLPSGKVTATLAVIFYFVLLASALFLTANYVDSQVSFLYYALIVLCISYSYITEYLAGLKSLYVAISASIPILISVLSYPTEKKFYFVIVAFFLIITGREICMDIKDRAGDVVSFMHKIDPKSLATFAFSLQTLGFVILSLRVGTVTDFSVLSVMICLFVFSMIYWFRFGKYKYAIMLMKIPYFIGLYFLI